MFSLHVRNSVADVNNRRKKARRLGWALFKQNSIGIEPIEREFLSPVCGLNSHQTVHCSYM